jgi:hypothetical protein
LQLNFRIFAVFGVKSLVIAGVSLVTGIALKRNSDVRDAIFVAMLSVQTSHEYRG